jgi:hypothetical protein
MCVAIIPVPLWLWLKAKKLLQKRKQPCRNGRLFPKIARQEHSERRQQTKLTQRSKGSQIT